MGGQTASTYGYAYSLSTATAAGLDNWTGETAETRPDGTTCTVYSNYGGETLVTDLSSATGSQNWYTEQQYGTEPYDAGDLVMQAMPSAVDGAPQMNPDGTIVASLNTSSGLIYDYVYYSSTTATSSTPGGAEGYLDYEQVSDGTAGSVSNVLDSYAYTTETVTQTVGSGSVEQTIYPVQTYATYSGAGTDATTYSYSFAYGTLQPDEITTTLPSTNGQNGPATAATEHDYYDDFGDLTWSQDPDGIVTCNVYNWIPGMLLETVQDINQSTANALVNGVEGVEWDYEPVTIPSSLSLPAGGLDATTDYSYDPAGRVTQILGPAHASTDDGGGEVRTATWYVYQDATHQVWSASGFATLDQYGNVTGYTMYNPVSIDVYDADGNLTDQIEATVGSGNTVSGPLSAYASDTFLRSSYTRWTHYDYGDGKIEPYGYLWDTKVYTGGFDTGDPTCIETSYGYNAMGEQDMEEDTTFTYTWTTYNALGLPVGVWVGTNDNGASDADPTGGRNGNMALNNMLQTTAYVYDEGNGGGDGLLTQEIDYVDSSTQRDTDYLYNWRDELAYTIEPAVTEPNGDSYQTYTYDAYDNLGEETVEATYAAGGTYVTGAGGPYLNSAPTGDGDTLLTQTGTAYDNLGQVYQTTTYDVEGGSVNTPGNLVDNYWRDADGNVLAYQAGGTDEFTKYAYNTLGETTNEYAGYDSVDEGGTMDYAEASSVTANDTILEQTDYTYDAAGNVTMEADHQRFLGDAPAGSGGTEGLLTGTTSRTSYTAYWYNGIGHETYSADYGMQTSTPSRSEAGPPARESSSTLVNPDTVLVTSYAYNNDGELYQTTDPMGNTDQTTYDAAGRVTESIENYVYGKPTLGNQDQTDQDVTTDYVYEVPGTPQETTMTVTTSDGNKGVNTQQTTYVYGTDVSDNGTAADPEIYSNDLLRAVIYADSDNTFTPPVDGSTGTLNDYSGYNRVQYTYDLQGEVTSMEDQNQTVHTYGYDSLGRETSDAVTSHQNGKIDTSVMQIDQSYDDEGNLADVASLNASAQTVNDVQMTYNGMGEMEDEYQEHIGQVDTSNSLYTAYGYSGASDGNYRLTSIADPTYAGSSTSPNQIDFNYSGSDATDNAINRLYSIEYGSSGSPSTVATYGYLGLDSIVQQQYNQPGLALSYAGTPDANGVVKGYTGLNQFNKVVDQVWSQAGNPNAADEFQYGYDQAGDVMYKLNKAADALAGIVMPPFVDVGDSPAAQQGSATPYLDELYSYNNLGELTGMSRGEIEPSSITAGTPSMDSTNLTQDWDLDGMGNWSSYTSTPSTTGGTGSSASETRQVNGSNQIISSTGIVLPSYDNVGNMTTMPSPSDPSTTSLDAKYDAWGRLTEVDHGSQPLAMYQYDGLGRLVVEATGFSSGDTTWGSASTYTHYYYAAGQVVETRVTTSATQAPAGVSPQYQYVWSAMTDAPILRAALSGPYEGQTIYYLTDAEGNVTTLVGYNSTADQWQPVERYVYDPYGNVTVYDATWITSYGTASQYGNTFLYGGMMYDAATGLYYASARWYNPAVGQFTSPDPTGFAAGDANLYRYVDDNPATMTDPWGLSGGAGGEQWDPGEGTVYSPDGGDGGGEGAWASQMGGGGAAAATSATSRVWKDNNGKVIIEGTLVGVQGNRVLIRRSSDGKVISVNAVDLGKAERDYVVGQQKNNGVYQTGTVSTNSGKTRGKVLLIVGRTVVLLTEDGKVVSVAITSLRKQDQKTVVRLKTFLSVREALKDWAGTYWLVTIGGGVEYASNIWARRQADGSYIYGYTSPNSGMPGGRSVDPPGITDIPNGTQIIGQIHSHPNGGALNFSTIRTAGQNSDEFYIQAMDPITQQTLGITLQYYLVNPNGDLLIWDRDKHKGVQFGE